jgi:hypothetical protein
MECNKYLDKLSSIRKVFEKYTGTDVLIAQAIKLRHEFFDIKQIRKPINKLITKNTTFLFANEVKVIKEGVESPLYHTLKKIPYYSYENENKNLKYVKAYTERVENMIEAGANINIGINIRKDLSRNISESYESLLFYCINNNISNTIINKLLEKNVNVDEGLKYMEMSRKYSSKSDISSLEIAIHNKQYELAHILLHRGADPNHIYIDSTSYDKYDKHNFTRTTALHMAIEENNIELVKHLLEKDADINQIYFEKYEDGYKETTEVLIKTAIFTAIENKNIEIVKLILERKPDFSIRYKNTKRNYDEYEEDEEYEEEEEQEYVSCDKKYKREGIHILDYIEQNDLGEEIYNLIKEQHIVKTEDPNLLKF